MIDKSELEYLVRDELNDHYEIEVYDTKKWCLHCNVIDKEQMTTIEKKTESEWVWFDKSPNHNCDYVFHFERREQTWLA